MHVPTIFSQKTLDFPGMFTILIDIVKIGSGNRILESYGKEMRYGKYF